MKIIENGDGTVSVQGDSGTILSTHATTDEARTWLIEQITGAGDITTADKATLWVDQMMAGTLPAPRTDLCHYCGLPTTRGYCAECGTEPRI